MALHACPADAPGDAEPRLEVADLFRRFGPEYLRTHIVSPAQAKALRATFLCRTAALGGHVDVCTHCGHRGRPSYNSCRNRHCPTCQGSEAVRWIADRVERLVETHHFHVVFTLPAELRPVALANPGVVYDLLFAAATNTLLALATSRWNALPAVTAVLHTWTREMAYHPHLHTIVTGGGLSTDSQRWVACRPGFLFPVKVLSKLFRGKFLDGLARARNAGKLRFVGTSAALAHPLAWAALMSHVYRAAFVVYAKKPFGGAEQVLRYLGRYTHRVAIGSSRLVAVDDDAIVFRTRGRRTCTLPPKEFVRRFLLHVLPDQFRKIRHYGLAAPSNVPTRLARAQALVRAAGRRARRAHVVVVHIDAAPGDRPCPTCGVGALLRIALHPARAPPPT